MPNKNRQSPNRLTRRKVEQALPGRHTDGHGLALVVSPGLSKRWEQRITIHGRRTAIGVGSYPVVTLDDARDIALENLRVARRGGNARRPKAKPTLIAMVDQYLGEKGGDYKTVRQADDFRNSLCDHALSAIGNIPVDRIEPLDIKAVLDALVEQGRHARARTVATRIGQVLTYAMALGYRDRPNPCPDLVKTLPSRPRTVHHAAIGLDEAPRIYRKVTDLIESATHNLPAATAFTMLTVARVSEVVAMEWSEVDLTAGIWARPGEKMKAGRPHSVALSGAAKTMLADQMKRSAGYSRDDLVYPGRKGRLAAKGIGMTLKRAAGDDSITAHGIRSTFTDFARERGFAQELWDHALAHGHYGVQAAYARGDLVEARRPLMVEWSEFLEKRTHQAILKRVREAGQKRRAQMRGEAVTT